jgi:Zinc knuckle
MAMEFDLGIALRLPPLAKAGVEESRDFLNAVEAYHELLNDIGKTTLLKFVIKSKITGAAKTKIGDGVVENFEQLQALIRGKCGVNESFDSLSAQLKCAKRGKKSEEEFAAQLEALGNQLADLEIQRSGELANVGKSAIRGVFERQTLAAFNQGLSRVEVRTAVIAARPSTMSDALSVAVGAKAAAGIEVKQETLLAGSAGSFLGCFNCGKEGHFARECRSSVNYNQGQSHNRGWRGPTRCQSQNRGWNGPIRGQGPNRNNYQGKGRLQGQSRGQNNGFLGQNAWGQRREARGGYNNNQRGGHAYLGQEDNNNNNNNQERQQQQQQQNNQEDLGFY